MVFVEDSSSLFVVNQAKMTKVDSKLGVDELLMAKTCSIPDEEADDDKELADFDYVRDLSIQDFEECEEAPYLLLIQTYLMYLYKIVYGHIIEAVDKLRKPNEYRYLKYHDGYAPLSSDFEAFYTRRLYRPIRDCFNRPITGVAGRTVTLLDRFSRDGNNTFELSGKKRECLNLSSYNYLGFAQSEGPCADEVEQALKMYGPCSGGALISGNKLDLHRQTEELVARFLGVEDALVVSMGFATNSTSIPALVDKGCLVISDELNHASLVSGIRLSGASVKVFKHNNVADLESVLRKSIADGQSLTRRPWRKILVVVEGLYSMEGTLANLPEILKLRSKYKFYLYVDEAHSIGALGPNGRGVCDYFGIDTKEIDVLMGTFTKSFGSAGGYIAGKRNLINHLRIACHGSIYSEAVSPPVAQQIYSSMRIISGEDGTDAGRRRIAKLARNCRFFSKELRKMGFIIYGHPHSPVVPLLLFDPNYIAEFSREMLKRDIAVVVVGYPATAIISGRVRFCISASHSLADLKRALDEISVVGGRMRLKVSSRKHLYN